jgi:hypothetical protein
MPTVISWMPERNSTAASTHTQPDGSMTFAAVRTMIARPPSELTTAISVPNTVASFSGTSEKAVSASSARPSSWR